MSDSTFLGSFTLDPGDPDFADLRSVCEPGNPWRCLIATKGSMELGKRMSVRLDHGEHAGTIGVTHGDQRYERPMTAEEVRFATRFDMGEQIKKPLTVTVDVEDGTWKAKPKAKTSNAGRKTPANNRGRGPNNKHIKTIRQRQLDAIRKGTFNPAAGKPAAPVTEGRCNSCGYTTVRCAELGCPA
jgi:hypothetical protein